MTTPSFQTFQREMARHLRDPHHTPRPAGVPARRMGVYNELLFNNITGFLDRCFPVCRAVLGEARWRGLNRSFWRDWPLHSPLHRDMTREFVRYLQSRPHGRWPAWLPELARYEWAELAVDLMDVVPPPHDADGDLQHGALVLNPAMMNLSFEWPVHRIGPDHRPRKPQPTGLLVYRDREEAVQFVHVNPVTARLLQLLGEQAMPGEAACRQLASELQHPDPAQLLAFGLQLLAQLRERGVVLGTAV